MSHHPRRLPSLAAVSLVALVLAACSGGGSSTLPSSQPSTGGSEAPAESPATGDRIDHPTGAEDIVLRYDEGGGFVMPAFTAANAPHFTLYGDGTVIFRNPMADPPPAQGSAFVMSPFRTIKLTDEQIQEILGFALGDGGLAGARENYTNDMVADASTAIFTIDAGGVQKVVNVYALGLDDIPGVPDAPARAAFARLAQRLTDFDNGGTAPTDVYTPPAYRVTLIDSPGMVAPDIRDWPWADVAIDEFKPSADPNGLQFPHVTMSADQVEALGITDFAGGFQNLVVTGPDGKTYTLAVRPLLPGETE